MQQQASLLVAHVRALVAALKGTDLAAARAEYAAARPCYERTEPVAESFAGLDLRLSTAAVTMLAHAVQAVAEPLSRVAGKVVNA